MLVSGKHKEYITEKIALLTAEISSLTKQGLYNQNMHCEYLIKNILNIVYDWELINLNTVWHNYPSIDLGDLSNRVAVQVTSTKTSAKVNETLKKFFNYSLNDSFDKLFIFILTSKQGSYSITEKQDSIMLFNETEHIIDFRDIQDQLSVVSNDQLVRLYHLFKTEFSISPNYIQDNQAISNMIQKFTQQQIGIQKNSRKYIPSIFVETSEVKELARYFIIPKFYYRALDDIDKNAINNLGTSLNEFSLGNIECNIKPKLVNITKDVIDHAKENSLLLTELKVEYDEKSKTLKDMRDKLFSQEPIPRKAWKYSYSSYLSSWFLDESIDQFQLLCERILLITSVAGKGKTNFICDLVENVLIKRSFDCLFFAGNEFNNIDLDNIGDYIIGRTFKTHYIHTFNEFTSYYQKIFEMSGKHLFIVIDGLNEVNDLTMFPTKLCNFIEILLSYDFIKLILSCRSEFFTERFKCLTEADFSNEIHRFSDFNIQMTDSERNQLYEGYLQHYKIHIEHISDEAYEQLSSDPLLLRIFCDANTTTEGTVIPILMNLNKEHIFEKYYQFKITQFSPVSQHPIPISKPDKPIVNVFNKIVKWMLDNECYSNIDIEQLSLVSEEEEILSRMINEDVLMRKDIMQYRVSGFCLNYTYDEFRDFLIARYLLVASTDISLLKTMLNDILKPESPIYEGVMKFLFHISRRRQDANLIELLKGFGWYDNLFIQEVFQLDDKLVNSDDLERIENVVRTEGSNSREFIINLIGRPDQNETPILNIRLLLRILRSLNENEYRLIFGRLFYYSPDKNNMHVFNTINATKLIEDLFDIVAEKCLLNNVLLNYLALVIFMLESKDYRLRDKSRILLKRFLDYYKEDVTDLLVEHINAIKINSLKARIQDIL